jgi:hypothetical protein
MSAALSIPVSGSEARSILGDRSPRLPSPPERNVQVVVPRRATWCVQSRTTTENNQLPRGAVTHGAFPSFEQYQHSRLPLGEQTATLRGPKVVNVH